MLEDKITNTEFEGCRGFKDKKDVEVAIFAYGKQLL